MSVASGADINIQHGATVKLLNLTTDDEYWETSTGTAEEPVGAVSDPNGALYDLTTHNSVNFSGGAGGGHLVFSRSANLTYRGNISGDLDLTQRGTDTVLLSGDNTYTGGTIVSSGTLVVNTSTALPAGGA